MNFWKIIFKPQNFVRHYGSLVGKIIASPTSLAVEDLKEILWTAIELQEVLKGKNTKLDVIKGARVLLIMKEPSMYLEVPAIRACEILGVNFNVIVDPKWDLTGFMPDTLKYFELNADLVMVQCRFQFALDCAGNIKIPLFTAQSLRYTMLQALADLMTMQMKCNYLRNLKVAWLGPPNRLLNTYLVLGPKMGMNISYCCSFNVETMQSPASLDVAKKMCLATKSTLEECNTLQGTISGANVIASSRHGMHNFIVSMDTLDLAGKDSWVIFDLPRGHNIIDANLIENENRCLTWHSVRNLKWILAAVMIRLLSDYKPVIDIPKF